MHTRRFLAAIALLGLAGCANNGMSEAECRVADWRTIGFEDGARGATVQRIGSHRAECAEHGVAPDFESYREGHAEGLEMWCRPQNGTNLGNAGYRYNGVCPADLEEPFLSAYSEAYGLYERRKHLQALQRTLSAKQQRVKQVEVLLVQKSAAILLPTLLPAERAAIAVEIKHLGEERGRLDGTIHDLEHECDEAAAELDRYQGELALND